MIFNSFLLVYQRVIWTGDVRPVDDTSIPSGELRALAGGAMDLRQRGKIGGAALRKSAGVTIFLGDFSRFIEDL